MLLPTSFGKQLRKPQHRTHHQKDPPCTFRLTSLTSGGLLPSISNIQQVVDDPEKASTTGPSD